MSEALEHRQPLLRRLTGESWWHNLKATSTRRALLLTALGGLLIGGLITVLPTRGDGKDPLAAYVGGSSAPSGARGGDTFTNAHTADCLNWPDKSPDAAVIVPCSDDHRFEVAESVDMRTFPGSEYGAGAAPPSASQIHQINQEQCQASVRRYLGTHYDPNSKFTVSLLWSGDKAWTQSGERRILCGLQLPGAGNTQVAFKGRIAELDQSTVWPAGTCLGIDPATNQPTNVPVDCAGPHALEITGAVNLAEKFPGALPAEADQDAFIKDSCTTMTDAYLAPNLLRNTTLALLWSTISLPSWTAGSHQVACKIGATLGDGGWGTLVGGARSALLINGQPPIKPPDIPDGRMTLPPIPMDMPPPDQGSPGSQGSQTQVDTSNPVNGTQHLPNAPGPQTPQPQTTNTFMGGPPPPPAAPQAPQDQAPGGAPPGDTSPGGAPAGSAPAPGGPAPGEPAPGGPPAGGPPAGGPPPGAPPGDASPPGG